jgi:putative ABC transport system permease protein
MMGIRQHLIPEGGKALEAACARTNLFNILFWMKVSIACSEPSNGWENYSVYFLSLAIFIACLGLFALAAFTTEQRTKEIGVRKSMGASVFSLINSVLSKEFTKLVVIAFIPAAILAWYISDTWLNGFAYRVEINPIVFVLSGVAAILIAWLTVSYQSIKAATANPVESLRYE